MDNKRTGVRGAVWAMAFAGFAILAVGYFAVLLQAPSEFPWPYIALVGGLVMLFSALPVQFILEVIQDRQLRDRSSAKRL